MLQRAPKQLEGSSFTAANEEKNWGDLSASGDLAKFQRFDFLKKRKDGTSLGETQSLKQFQQLKRSEILSPSHEGKSNISRFHYGEATSASKAEDKTVFSEQTQASMTPMEFKKKKFCPPSCLKVEQPAIITPFSELKPQPPTDDLIIRKSKGKKLRDITIEDF